MSILELFSYRKRTAEREVPDVYEYDSLPQELRVQIVQILIDAIGRKNFASNQMWRKIHNSVAREHGVFRLSSGNADCDMCTNYVLNSSDKVEKLLDLIEFSFYCIHEIDQLPFHERRLFGEIMSSGDAINELNERFRRACVGYQFECGKIIRIDSDLIHAEIVKPALQFLSESGFAGPRVEFLQAHEHYRNGNNKEAVTNANNAFESTLKVICDDRGWSYSPKATATQLIEVVQNEGLFPDYLGRSFSQLVSTLKSGLPQVRHKHGSHGVGKKPQITPDYIAAYAIHLAAANILFLVDSHKSR